MDSVPNKALQPTGNSRALRARLLAVAEVGRQGFGAAVDNLITVALPWVGATIGDAALSKLVDLLVDWSAKRISKGRSRSRGRRIRIFDGNGNVVSKV